MNNNKGISAATLKWIAIISMLIDHFALAVYWQMQGHNFEIYSIMRDYIGRIAYPIYCFLLVEGFFHTKNAMKYVSRCIAFAFISEIPFNLAIFGQIFYLEKHNVYFTLSLGLLAMLALQHTLKYRENEILFMILQVAIVFVFAKGCDVLNVDYGNSYASLFIIGFYYLKCCEAYLEKKYYMILSIIMIAIVEPMGALAIIPIYFYNGTRGKQKQYIYYWIYPVHLLIFGLIRIYLTGQLILGFY